MVAHTFCTGKMGTKPSEKHEIFVKKIKKIKIYLGRTGIVVVTPKKVFRFENRTAANRWTGRTGAAGQQ